MKTVLVLLAASALAASAPAGSALAAAPVAPKPTDWPTNNHDAADDAKYQAIGESDRMTLRFVKPARE